MVHTIASLIAVTLLLGGVDIARSIAPGDEDLLCTREPRYAKPHLASRRIVLDSHNYQNLLYGVWQHVDKDGQGLGVSSYNHR